MRTAELTTEHKQELRLLRERLESAQRICAMVGEDGAPFEGDERLVRAWGHVDKALVLVEELDRECGFPE